MHPAISHSVGVNVRTVNPGCCASHRRAASSSGTSITNVTGGVAAAGMPPAATVPRPAVSRGRRRQHRTPWHLTLGGRIAVVWAPQRRACDGLDGIEQSGPRRDLRRGPVGAVKADGTTAVADIDVDRDQRRRVGHEPAVGFRLRIEAPPHSADSRLADVDVLRDQPCRPARRSGGRTDQGVAQDALDVRRSRRRPPDRGVPEPVDPGPRRTCAPISTPSRC